MINVIKHTEKKTEKQSVTKSKTRLIYYGAFLQPHNSCT